MFNPTHLVRIATVRLFRNQRHTDTHGIADRDSPAARRHRWNEEALFRNDANASEALPYGDNEVDSRLARRGPTPNRSSAPLFQPDNYATIGQYRPHVIADERNAL